MLHEIATKKHFNKSAIFFKPVNFFEYPNVKLTLQKQEHMHGTNEPKSRRTMTIT